LDVQIIGRKAHSPAGLNGRVRFQNEAVRESNRRGQEEPREPLKICSDLRSYKHLGCVNEPKTTQISTSTNSFLLTTPRHDIAITDCEAGDEGEIDGVADRPALDNANQHAKDNLNRKNHRQDRPREAKGVADATKKRRRTVFGVGRSMRALKSSGRLGAYDASCSVGVAFWGFL
jgi:hypothetical protein